MVAENFQYHPLVVDVWVVLQLWSQGMDFQIHNKMDYGESCPMILMVVWWPWYLLKRLWGCSLCETVLASSC